MYLTTEILRKYVEGKLPPVPLPPSSIIISLAPEVWSQILYFCELYHYGIMASLSEYIATVALDSVTLLDYCGQSPNISDRPRCTWLDCYCCIRAVPGMCIGKSSHGISYHSKRIDPCFILTRNKIGDCWILSDGETCIKNGPGSITIDLPLIGTVVLHGQYLNGREEQAWYALRRKNDTCYEPCGWITLKDSIADGPWTYTYSNGMKVEGNFLEQRLHGQVKIMRLNSTKIRTYDRGLLSGYYFYRNNRNGMTITGNYKNGYQDGKWRYLQPDGKKIYHTYRKPKPSGPPSCPVSEKSKGPTSICILF